MDTRIILIMKKVYVVLSSWGSYEDYRDNIESVFSNIFSAENKKTELENKYREEIPFPFDWCTEREFEQLQHEGKTAPEDDKTYYYWWDKNNQREEFNCCLIQEVDFYE